MPENAMAPAVKTEPKVEKKTGEDRAPEVRQHPANLQAQILQLQRTVGNRAVSSLHESQGKKRIGSAFDTRMEYVDATPTLSPSSTVSARATIPDQDIFSREGEYSPGSSCGRELLAHKLTDVIQQEAKEHGTLFVGTACGPYGQEAHRVAQAISAGQIVGVLAKTGQAGPSAVQRDIAESDLPHQRELHVGDALAQQRARELHARNQEAKELEGSYKPPSGGMVEKGVDWVIEQGAKKVEQAENKFKPKVEPKGTPETDFLEDMKTGTEKANGYLKKINEFLDLWAKTGVRPPQLDVWVKALEKVTDTLKNVPDKLDKARKIVGWVQAFAKVVDTTRSLDFTDRNRGKVSAELKNWIESLKNLSNWSQGLVEWLQTAAKSAAESGAASAEWLGVLGAVTPIILAQVQIGLAVLEQGQKNIEAYFQRIEDMTTEKVPLRAGLPEPPDQPEPFFSQAEIREWQARQAVGAEHTRRVRLQAEAFEKHFANVYARRRIELIRDLPRKYKKTCKDRDKSSKQWEITPEENHLQNWIQFFGGWITYTDDGEPEVHIPKEVKPKQLKDEIDNLVAYHDQRVGYPEFDKLYNDERAKFLAKHPLEAYGQH